jgi:hypothetical protein
MDSSTLLYLAAFFFILGAAFVAVFWALGVIIRRFSRKNKAPSAADSTLTEIARLMRDNKTQDMVVQIDGKNHKSFEELSPPQQRRLIFSSSVLSKWLGHPAPADSTAPEDQPPSSSAEQLASTVPEPPVTESDWIPAETVLVEPQTHTVPPFMTDPVPEVKPVSTQLPDVVGAILKPTPIPAPVFKSIAMQINDILQARISGTPFEARGITVNDGPDHGVLVTVDGEKYQGVKDVPDESVRNLIRSAVMEWEKQGKASTT